VIYNQELTKFVQGYLIGNPATDVDYDFNSFVPFAHGMGLISNDMYEVCGSALMLVLFTTLIVESVPASTGDGRRSQPLRFTL
jgi:hypothetical protein